MIKSVVYHDNNVYHSYSWDRIDQQLCCHGSPNLNLEILIKNLNFPHYLRV